MSRSLIREKLQADKAYTFVEVFDLVAPAIGPEIALQKYNKIADAAGTKTRLPRDSAITSGKRSIIRNMLKQMQVRGTVTAADGIYKLVPEKQHSVTGVEHRHVESWLKEAEWVLLDDMVDKARQLCDEDAMISLAEYGLAAGKNPPREEMIRRGCRRRVMDLLAGLSRKGLVDQEQVIRYRRRRFARPNS